MPLGALALDVSDGDDAVRMDRWRRSCARPDGPQKSADRRARLS